MNADSGVVPKQRVAPLSEPLAKTLDFSNHRDASSKVETAVGAAGRSAPMSRVCRRPRGDS
ncbi:MAG: hypothetical protein J6X44_11670 [Thermoguttaceae bacterium]|nr:hypothetical protein [Thermoguttaceae bacterium]